MKKNLDAIIPGLILIVIPIYLIYLIIKKLLFTSK